MKVGPGESIVISRLDKVRHTLTRIDILLAEEAARAEKLGMGANANQLLLLDQLKTEVEKARKQLRKLNGFESRLLKVSAPTFRYLDTGSAELQAENV